MPYSVVTAQQACSTEMFKIKAEKNEFLSLHYLVHVSICYLAVYAAEIYEL